MSAQQARRRKRRYRFINNQIERGYDDYEAALPFSLGQKAALQKDWEATAVRLVRLAISPFLHRFSSLNRPQQSILHNGSLFVPMDSRKQNKSGFLCYLFL